jgi:transcriptional regulator with XRE-family HTH domain
VPLRRADDLVASALPTTGAELLAWREARGIEAMAFARALGTSRPRVRRWESGAQGESLPLDLREAIEQYATTAPPRIPDSIPRNGAELRTWCKQHFGKTSALASALSMGDSGLRARFNSKGELRASFRSSLAAAYRGLSAMGASSADTD